MLPLHYPQFARSHLTHADPTAPYPMSQIVGFLRVVSQLNMFVTLAVHALQLFLPSSLPNPVLHKEHAVKLEHVVQSFPH